MIQRRPAVSDEKLKVLLVDDHEIVRHGLEAYFQSESGLEMWHSVGNAADALDKLASSSELPDVAVLDVRLPDVDGISLCRDIRAGFPSVHCLMLSSYSNQDAVFGALMSGASGFVLKETRLEELVGAIKEVAAGRSLLDPEVTSRVLEKIRADDRKVGTQKLTDSESKVLELISRGMTNREISEELHLAEQTVKNYVSTILSKLGMKRRTQAAIYAANLKRDEADETRS